MKETKKNEKNPKNSKKIKKSKKIQNNQKNSKKPKKKIQIKSKHPTKIQKVHKNPKNPKIVKNGQKNWKIPKNLKKSQKFIFFNFFFFLKILFWPKKNIYLDFRGGTLSVRHKQTEILVSNLGSLDGIQSRI